MRFWRKGNHENAGMKNIRVISPYFYLKKNHVHLTDILGYNAIHSRSVAIVKFFSCVRTLFSEVFSLSDSIYSSLMERYHHSHYSRETVGGILLRKRVCNTQGLHLGCYLNIAQGKHPLFFLNDLALIVIWLRTQTFSSHI